MDEDDYDPELWVETCRWRGCTADATEHGFCEPHYATL